MFELPVHIDIDGELHPIRNRGDYRMVLDCFLALNDDELDDIDRVLSSLVIFYEELSDASDVNAVFGEHTQEAAEKMFLFFNCGQTSVGNKHNHKLVDWEKDQQLIASAVNKAAGMEIRNLEYLHWWTFMGYYLAVDGKSSWSSIVSIRNKIKSNKKLDKNELEFKRDNPEYFVWDSRTLSDKQAEASISDIWNSTKEDKQDA